MDRTGLQEMANSGAAARDLGSGAQEAQAPTARRNRQLCPFPSHCFRSRLQTPRLEPGGAVRLRSSANALSSVCCRKSDLSLPLLFLSGVTLIFRVSLTELSTPPFRRLFSLPSPSPFFSLSFCFRHPQPSTPARAWP